MKVNDNSIQNEIANLRNTALEKNPGQDLSVEKPSAPASDRVELSVNREKIDRLTSALAATESMNTEKIESIKNRIADGTYQVNGQDVAEKMLRSMGLLSASGDE